MGSFGTPYDTLQRNVESDIEIPGSWLKNLATVSFFKPFLRITILSQTHLLQDKMLDTDDLHLLDMGG